MYFDSLPKLFEIVVDTLLFSETLLDVLLLLLPFRRSLTTALLTLVRLKKLYNLRLALTGELSSGYAHLRTNYHYQSLWQLRCLDLCGLGLSMRVVRIVRVLLQIAYSVGFYALK